MFDYNEVAEDLTKLRKEQIGDFLNLAQKEINNTRKEQLLSKLMLLLYENEVLLRGVYKEFRTDLGFHPCKVEELLNITKTERLRWTQQKKLKVVEYCTFKKWGKKLEYPNYDSYQIRHITQVQINNWRLQHESKIKVARRKATQNAVKTRTENKTIEKDFYENKWKKMLEEWYLTDSKLGASLQLAFWTMWISRWAKEFQVKARNARIHKEDYEDKKEKLYSLKNEALQKLIISPFSKISFYQPLDPRKITYLEFCPLHYDQWMEERKFDYVSKWDFYYSHEKKIQKCQQCNVEIENDYYSLFFLSIGHLDYNFSFHTPYPIGSEFFPSKESLPQISHQEQEGLFRFGRTLFNEEKIIFKEKEVFKQFNEALLKFDFHFGLSPITNELESS